jgi:hypothetical protein
MGMKTSGSGARARQTEQTQKITPDSPGGGSGVSKDAADSGPAAARDDEQCQHAGCYG